MKLAFTLLLSMLVVAQCGARDRTEELNRQTERYLKDIDAITDPVTKIATADSLLSVARRLPLSSVKGLAFKVYGSVQQEYGDQVTAHDYFWQAIDTFEKSDGDNTKWISDCYYRMAIDYLNSQDTLNMKAVIDRLDVLRRSTDDHVVIHDYWAVLSAYYAVLLDFAPDNEAVRDSMLDAAKAAIRETDLMNESEWRLLNPVWDYYNVAFFYDTYFTPPVADSVTCYLDAAERIIDQGRISEVLVDEGRISIWDLRAWQMLRKGHYAQAERQMDRVVELLDRNESIRPNTLITERNETYRFFVELAQRRGDWRKAFEYQKLVTESNKLRYDIEKAEAIDDVRTQFAIEKHQRRIVDLEDTNRRAWTLFAGAVIMVLVFAGGIIAVILYAHQRKINMEQRLYESALTAEFRQRELLSLRQSLSSSPTASSVETIRVQIAASSIGAEQKDAYLKALDALDLDTVDRLLLQAVGQITAMDRKYVVCFMTGMTTGDICTLFSVEPASVYVVRYRIKRKFAADAVLPF